METHILNDWNGYYIVNEQGRYLSANFTWHENRYYHETEAEAQEIVSKWIRWHSIPIRIKNDDERGWYIVKDVSNWHSDFLCKDLTWRNRAIYGGYYSTKEEAEAKLHKWRLKDSGNE